MAESTENRSIINNWTTLARTEWQQNTYNDCVRIWMHLCLRITVVLERIFARRSQSYGIEKDHDCTELKKIARVAEPFEFDLVLRGIWSPFAWNWLIYARMNFLRMRYAWIEQGSSWNRSISESCPCWEDAEEQSFYFQHKFPIESKFRPWSWGSDNV